MSTGAHAIPVTIEVVGADWTNVQGGTDLNFADNDGIAGNESLSWGVGFTSAGQSGYTFAGAAPPAFTVNTGDVFGLGTLTHNNFTIFAGGGITGATLNISTMLTIAGAPITEGPFNFSLFHNETPNNCNPQPTCANDIVTFANNPSNTDTFNIDGTEYTFNLSSFLFNGTTASSFSSPEGGANTATINASIDAVTPVSVPEPSSMLLLGLGMTAMVATRRRKKLS